PSTVLTVRTAWARVMPLTSTPWTSTPGRISPACERSYRRAAYAVPAVPSPSTPSTTRRTIVPRPSRRTRCLPRPTLSSSLARLAQPPRVTRARAFRPRARSGLCRDHGDAAVRLRDRQADLAQALDPLAADRRQQILLGQELLLERGGLDLTVSNEHAGP